MMFHVLCRLGYGVSLDAAARGTGVDGKPEGMNGKLAPTLWAEGKREEVLRYVAQDVRTTLELARVCESWGGARRWVARSGKVRMYDFGRGMADGPGGSGTAAPGYLVDGRAVAEGEVHGVDGGGVRRETTF